MEFYILEYPGRKNKVFLNEKDAKNSLGNLGNIYKGKIICYIGQKSSIITGFSKDGANYYVERLYKTT